MLRQPRSEQRKKPRSHHQSLRPMSRHAKLRKITEDGAAKLRQEAEEKQVKADERQLKLVKEAAVEFSCLDSGRKQKPAPAALRRMAWPRACTRAVQLWPVTLRSILRCAVENRASIEEPARTDT